MLYEERCEFIVNQTLHHFISSVRFQWIADGVFCNYSLLPHMVNIMAILVIGRSTMRGTAIQHDCIFKPFSSGAHATDSVCVESVCEHTVIYAPMENSAGGQCRAVPTTTFRWCRRAAVYCILCERVCRCARRFLLNMCVIRASNNRDTLAVSLCLSRHVSPPLRACEFFSGLVG